MLAALAEPEPEPLAPAARPHALSGQQDSPATAVVRTIRLTDTKQQQATKPLPDRFKGFCEVACQVTSVWLLITSAITLLPVRDVLEGLSAGRTVFRLPAFSTDIL